MCEKLVLHTEAVWGKKTDKCKNTAHPILVSVFQQFNNLFSVTPYVYNYTMRAVTNKNLNLPWCKNLHYVIEENRDKIVNKVHINKQLIRSLNAYLNECFPFSNCIMETLISAPTFTVFCSLNTLSRLIEYSFYSTLDKQISDAPYTCYISRWSTLSVYIITSIHY